MINYSIIFNIYKNFVFNSNLVFAWKAAARRAVRLYQLYIVCWVQVQRSAAPVVSGIGGALFFEICSSAC